MARTDLTKVSPQAHVWVCSSNSQIYAAAFEVHEAAMSHGFMPDEATSLSLSLAQLATNAVKEGSSTARVEFEPEGWKLEVATSKHTEVARYAREG
jgi:hypothetical protein